MQPTLHTKRLTLRPFTLADAPEVQRLAGDRVVASQTLSIPHPYENGMAEDWIRTHPKEFAAGRAAIFALTLADFTLCGAIGLGILTAYRLAELGYWLGQPYWGQGLATEAARAVLAYGFQELNLNRIQATHFSDNPASGRVMEKIGMAYEGCRPEHTYKWGEFKDIKLYGILRRDWLATNEAAMKSGNL